LAHANFAPTTKATPMRAHHILTSGLLPAHGSSGVEMRGIQKAFKET